jgi:hypothetical protein
MIPILAKVNQPLEVMSYLFLGAVFLGLSFIILRRVQENGYRLILLALLTATAGIGFGAFLPETVLIGTGTLMRIAFIMALGGVGSLLLSTQESSTAIATKKGKESKDAD